MEKKGLSAVVGTILIILLVIVAVGIIWAVASGLFKGGAEEMSTGFLIDLDIKSASLGVDGKTVSISVERKSGAGTLSGIKFVFSDGESSKSAEESTSMEQLDRESFSFDISSETGLGIPNAHEVSIAPIYKSESGKDILRNIVDRAEFREAGGGGNGGNGAVCGDGVIETGETCDDNNIISEDGCSSSCNVETGWSCVGEPSVCTEVGGGGCLTSANCTDLGYQCGEHDDWCGGIFICGPCDPGQACNATYLCESALLRSGAVDSIWPGDAPRYFDSDGLPTDGSEVDFVLKYINFSSNINLCYKIVGAEYVYNEGPPIYNKTHLELDLVATQLTDLDDFQIWKTQIACQGS